MHHAKNMSNCHHPGFWSDAASIRRGVSKQKSDTFDYKLPFCIRLAHYGVAKVVHEFQILAFYHMHFKGGIESKKNGFVQVLLSHRILYIRHSTERCKLPPKDKFDLF